MLCRVLGVGASKFWLFAGGLMMAKNVMVIDEWLRDFRVCVGFQCIGV